MTAQQIEQLSQLFEANAVMLFRQRRKKRTFAWTDCDSSHRYNFTLVIKSTTDIIHNCGLMDVVRAERGILYECRFAAALNDAQQAVFENGFTTG